METNQKFYYKHFIALKHLFLECLIVCTINPLCACLIVISIDTSEQSDRGSKLLTIQSINSVNKFL